MDNLIERLRTAGMVRTEGGYSVPREAETMREAADEIERLKERIRRAADSSRDPVVAHDLRDAIAS